MLRIASYYESRLGRNDGNPLYVTACLKRMQYYGNLLRGLPEDKSLLSWFVDKNLDPRAEKASKAFFDKYKEAIEMDHIYPTGDISPFGTYDLNMHIDWGEDGLKDILPYEPFKTPQPFAYWASDTHINNGIHNDSYPYRLETARRADLVFCGQKAGVEKMKQDGIPNPIWLPHAVEPLAYPKIELLDKKYDVCFVGHVSSTNREIALDRLFREFPNFYFGQHLFENAARKFAESKILKEFMKSRVPVLA